MDTQFAELKIYIQQVIDLAGQKKYSDANEKLGLAGDLLDEILDHSSDDADLIEISRYQVLLNQLQQKINTPPDQS